jgi:hypothetical protein
VHLDPRVPGQPGEQLRLLGVSNAQISKRLRLSKHDVRAARSVAASKLARAADDKYELDLTQAAAVAEFSVIWTRQDLATAQRFGGKRARGGGAELGRVM